MYLPNCLLLQYLEMQNQELQEDQLQYSDNQSPLEQENVLSPYRQPKQQKQQGLKKLQKVPLEIIYIIFYHYRAQMTKIAESFKCSFSVSMDFYVVRCPDQNNKDNFNNCLFELRKLVDSIFYQELKMPANDKYPQNNKTKYYQSPFINSYLNSRKIKLVKFYNKIFAFSRDLTKQLITKQISNITKQKMIFGVTYIGKRDLASGYNRQIYQQITAYLQKIIEHYNDFFTERKVFVEISQGKNRIHIIGERSKYMMESKKTMKNAVESMVCVIIKDSDLDSQKLSGYLKKVANYPVHLGRYDNKSYVLITKDNILKQILKNSKKLFDMINLDVTKQDKQLGFFIIPSLSLNKKVQEMRLKCKQKGYDLYKQRNIRFLRCIFFNQEKSADVTVVKQLLIQLTIALEEAKDRFQVMNRIQNDKPKKIQPVLTQQQKAVKFTCMGGKIQEQKLTKILRRDVLSQKVRMKKEYKIQFNCIEGVQDQIVYWQFITETAQGGKEVKQNQLKPGQYLKGRRRRNQTNEAYIYQEIIYVL